MDSRYLIVTSKGSVIFVIIAPYAEYGMARAIANGLGFGKLEVYEAFNYGRY